jgi:hypothetical protein
MKFTNENAGMDKQLERPLYLLPGDSRTQDRVVPGSMIRAETYRPSKDMSLTEDQRRFAVDLVVVTVAGEEKKTFPYILPVEFSPNWNSLADYAESVGRVLAEGQRDVKDEDQLGRSIITSWIALTDGTVHVVRKPGADGFVLTDRLPIMVEKKWLDQLMADQQQVENTIDMDRPTNSPID